MTKMLAVKFRNGREVMIPMHAVQTEISVVERTKEDVSTLTRTTESTHSYTLKNVYTGDVIGTLTETEFASVAAQLAAVIKQ